MRESRPHLPRHGVYFNGLVRTEVGRLEKLEQRYLRLRGFNIVHSKTDWHGDRPYWALLDDGTKLAREIIKQQGGAVIIGGSAGGGHAANVFGRLQGENVFWMSLSGYLSAQSDEERAHLEWVAMQRPKKQRAAALIDSVQLSGGSTLPTLEEAAKARSLTAYSLGDDLIPHSGMTYDGIQDYLLTGPGYNPNHRASIAVAGILLPRLVASIPAVQA